MKKYSKPRPTAGSQVMKDINASPPDTTPKCLAHYSCLYERRRLDYKQLRDENMSESYSYCSIPPECGRKRDRKASDGEDSRLSVVVLTVKHASQDITIAQAQNFGSDQRGRPIT